jgi:hypothetical protein
MQQMKNLGSRDALLRAVSLNVKPHYNKISWTSSNPYNKRWQFKWKPSYYSYPRDYKQEHTNVKKPEDSWDAVPLGWAWFMDLTQRGIPQVQCVWDRRHRLFDNF